MEMKSGLGLCALLLLFCEVLALDHVEPAVVDSSPLQNTVYFNETVSVAPLTKNLNEIVDLLLDAAKEIILKSGHDTIPIPNIDKEFTKKIKHFIKIKGKFHAEKGWFKSLASIRRTSDATLIHTGGNVTASVGLGLGTMELGFDHYDVKVEHIRVKGRIDAKASSNSVFAKVAVTFLDKGKCNLTMQELKIAKFGGLKVKVTGLKPLNWLLSRIATSIAKHMQDNAIHKAEQSLMEAAQKALNKYHCVRDADSFIRLMVYPSASILV